MQDEKQPTQGGRSPLLLVVGVFGILVALALAGGGGVLLWAHANERDANGYFATAARPFETDTHALTSDGLELEGEESGWLFEQRLLGAIRLEARGRDPGRPLFFGIGPADEVALYLDDVTHENVQSIELAPFRARYHRIPGAEEPAPPGDQGFWAVSAAGTGSQTLTWDVEEGTWTVVLMNADGSPGVAADLRARATVPLVPWIAGGVFLLATACLATAGFLLYLGTRPPRPQAPAETTVKRRY